MKNMLLAIICTDLTVLRDWSPLLEAKAREVGWSCGAELPGGSKGTDSPNHLLVTLDPYEALQADTVVILSAPQERWPNLDDPEVKTSLERDSFRLMQISMFALDRAFVEDATSPALEFQGLGTVVNAAPRNFARGTSPLSLYDDIPPSPLATAVWPASIMRFPQNGETDGGSEIIDLTGRARVLAHGPYVTLLPGAWAITYTLAIDPEGGMPNLMFEWGGTDMVELQMTIRRPGIYQCRQTQTWIVAEPAQLRISLAQAVFQGRLELRDIAVERISD